MDKSRRDFFRGSGTGIASVSSELRPPWVLAPASFTDTCTRCNRCVALCPEDIVRAGDGGFPAIDFTRGECTFCGRCASDCEAGLFGAANESDDSGWSHRAKVAEHCLTYLGVMCRSCEDACEPRAIRFSLSAGRVPQPTVNSSACTGCGACIRPCPEGAITMSIAAALQ